MLKTISLLPFLVTFVAMAAAPQGAPTGKVVQIVGNAKSAERTLTYGDPVYAGEVIRTETGSRVKILMSDRSIIDIGEDSAIRIRTYSSNANSESSRELELEIGSMRTSVRKSPTGKGKFFIRTKSSVLAVRGTVVGTTATSDYTQFVMFEGSGEIGGKILNAGQIFQKEMGVPGGDISNLSKREMENLLEEKYTTQSEVDHVSAGLMQDGAGRELASGIAIIPPKADAHMGPRNNVGGNFQTPPTINVSGGIPVEVFITFKSSRQ